VPLQDEMVGASQSEEKIDINACTVSLLLIGKIVYVTVIKKVKLVPLQARGAQRVPGS